MYDCTISIENTHKCVKLTQELAIVYSMEDFEMHDCVSNDKDVIAALEEKRNKSTVDVTSETATTFKTLGLSWDLGSAMLCFDLNLGKF